MEQIRRMDKRIKIMKILISKKKDYYFYYLFHFFNFYFKIIKIFVLLLIFCFTIIFTTIFLGFRKTHKLIEKKFEKLRATKLNKISFCCSSARFFCRMVGPITTIP